MQSARQLHAMRHPALASVVLVVAVALSAAACESGVVVSPSGSEASELHAATVSGTMWLDPAPFAGLSSAEHACSGGPYLTPWLDVVITSSSTVTMESATLELLNGTHVGGPMITIPQGGLDAEFGTAVVRGGHSRTFRFRPRFPCAGVPYGVAAQLTFRDHRGASHDVRLSRSLR
jgi:hypothetical protein